MSSHSPTCMCICRSFITWGMDRTELAWAAGFFDAEGWAAAVRHTGRERRWPAARINQADPDGVPEVLERFQAAVGVGRIGGPARKPGRRDLYRWEATSRADTTVAHAALGPWLGEVKRAQFRAALGVIDRAPANAPKDEQLAWAAGLFDGDGSTCFAEHRTHMGHRTAEVSITQSSIAGVPEALWRFQSVVGGIGRIYGPYKGRGCGAPIYRYKALRLSHAEHVIRSLWPWLGSAKRVQALVVLSRVTSQEPLVRGNPAWGNHKTHCVNGHEYATARIRRYVARSGGTERRASKQCLACLREWARQHREERRSPTAR